MARVDWHSFGFVVSKSGLQATVPEWQTVYAGNATDSGHEAADLGVPFGLGFLWGVGGVTFGLGCDMVGNSLGFSIILGMCSALGAAIPLVALHPDKVGSKQGIYTWIGLAIVSVGLYFLAVAGMSKEKEQSEGSLSEKTPLINDSRAPVYAPGVDIIFDPPRCPTALQRRRHRAAPCHRGRPMCTWRCSKFRAAR